jgi:hypothetical protein
LEILCGSHPLCELLRRNLGAAARTIGALYAGAPVVRAALRDALLGLPWIRGESRTPQLRAAVYILTFRLK